MQSKNCAWGVGLEVGVGGDRRRGIGAEGDRGGGGRVRMGRGGGLRGRTPFNKQKAQFLIRRVPQPPSNKPPDPM